MHAVQWSTRRRLPIINRRQRQTPQSCSATLLGTPSDGILTVQLGNLNTIDSIGLVPVMLSSRTKSWSRGLEKSIVHCNGRRTFGGETKLLATFERGNECPVDNYTISMYQILYFA